MIIGTSPNGIFTLDTSNNKIKWVLEGNFFGIQRYIDSNVIIVAENVVFKNNEVINNLFSRILVLDTKFNVKKVLYQTDGSVDIHQIYLYENKLFITKTSLDEVIYLELDGIEVKNIHSLLNIQKSNSEHKDQFHINALCVKDDNLLIGLNKNIRDKFSCIGKIKLTEIHNKFDYLNYERLNFMHSHDLELYRDDILISASHNGYIYSYNKRKPLFYVNVKEWVRGLVVNNMGIWVGFSNNTLRKNRRSYSFNNSINLYAHNNFEHLGQLKLPIAGQINDIIYIPKEEM